jgi:hypothetical protein
MTTEDGMPRSRKKSTKTAGRVGKPAARPPRNMFSGPRPESFLGGLEPAFVLFDSSVMHALRTRAAERGMEYDTLVRMIVREHVDDY